MKILVFTEPTVRGDWAIALAQDLASGLRGTVLLLTTEDCLARDPGILDRAAEKFASIPGVSVERKVRSGSAREAILLESNESRPAITVVPPAGRGGILRMLKGSRVKAVVHDSPSTVMVARKPVSDHIRSILVTVSGGPMSETTALGAQEIAEGLRAQITLLHVTSSVGIPFGGQAPAPSSMNLDRIREILSRGGSEPRMRVREGMVVHEIVAECEDGGYDLLILGQHLADRESGKSFSENIAEDLAMACPIPVLIVRPRRWAAAAAGPQENGAPLSK